MKYTLTVIIVLMIGLIAFNIYQQRAITSLRQEVASGVASNTNVSDNMSSTYLAVKKNIEDNTKAIKGTIISKNGNLLTIEASIVDFSKLSGLTEDELHQSIATFPTTKKNYKVSINDKTQFESLKFIDLLAGQMISIESEDLIYKNNNLVASKISVIVPNDEMPTADYLKQIKSVAGQIKEKNNKYFVVEVVWTDYSKIDKPYLANPDSTPKISKDYKVFFTDKTIFSKSNSSELQVGDSIAAYSNQPTFYVSEFTAEKIEGPQHVLKEE